MKVRRLCFGMTAGRRFFVAVVYVLSAVVAYRTAALLSPTLAVHGLKAYGNAMGEKLGLLCCFIYCWAVGRCNVGLRSFRHAIERAAFIAIALVASDYCRSTLPLVSNSLGFDPVQLASKYSERIWGRSCLSCLSFCVVSGRFRKMCRGLLRGVLQDFIIMCFLFAVRAEP